jgi:hypothetical protein
MPRGGHNWKGGCTVNGTHSLRVGELARSGYLAGSKNGDVEMALPQCFHGLSIWSGGRRGVP